MHKYTAYITKNKGTYPVHLTFNYKVALTSFE